MTLTGRVVRGTDGPTTQVPSLEQAFMGEPNSQVYQIFVFTIGPYWYLLAFR